MNAIAAQINPSAPYNIESLRNELPSYAKDIKLNLGTVLTPEGAPDLSTNQIAIIALSSAYATQESSIVKALEQEYNDMLTQEEKDAARAAAAIMGMNNIYYRFSHLVHDEELRKLPAKLRMNVIGSPGIAKADFELCSLAVSAINGCGMCMEAHVKEVSKAGVSKLGIQSAIRIAAVINGAAQAMTIQALSGY